MSNEIAKAGENLDTQLLKYDEPIPIQFDLRECNREIEARSTEWVQSNIIKLSKEFG
ncbi:hypothetical protein HAX54_010312, partial [Datura stramonium]|nr:hypothetical protein [Datura stramonium]